MNTTGLFASGAGLTASDGTRYLKLNAGGPAGSTFIYAKMRRLVSRLGIDVFLFWQERIRTLCHVFQSYRGYS